MYYIVEAETLSDGSNPIAIHRAETKDGADMQFYQVLSSAIANEACKTCLCVVMRDTGYIEQSKYWMRDEET